MPTKPIKEKSTVNQPTNERSTVTTIPETSEHTNTDTPNLYKVLTAYTEAGWDTPFPLPARQKHPPPNGYTGRNAHTPSPADLYAWSEDHPDEYNLGLHLPSDIIGIDVDDYGNKHGYDTLQQLQEQYGYLPSTIMSTSRDDGRSGIRLYRVPEGVEFPGVLGDGIDIIQNHHRYMVVAPSIHPEGGTYQWVDEDTRLIQALPSPEKIPNLPPAWVIGLQQEATTNLTPVEGTTAQQVIAALPGGTPCHHTHDLRDMWNTRMAGGLAAHDVMNKIVYETLLLGREGCPGSVTALTQVKQLFLTETSSRRNQLEAEREYQRSVEGAALKAANKPQVETGCKDDVTSLIPDNPGLPSTDPWVTGKPEPDHDNTPSTWAPANIEDAIAGVNKNPPPTYLARTDGASAFYPGTVNSIIGDSESGKTWLALHGIQQALNDDKRVLFIDLEDTAPGIVNRLRLIGVTPEQLRAQFTYVAPQEAINTPQATLDFNQLIEAGNDLIVLDGVSGCMRLFGWSVNSNDDVTDFDLKILKRMSRTGSSVVLIDHLPKEQHGNGGGGRAPGAIGAQHKRAMVTGSSLVVKASVKPRPGDIGELLVRVDKDRPGHVRASTDANGVLGRVEIDSTDPARTVITFEAYNQASIQQDAVNLIVEKLAAAKVPTNASASSAAKQAHIRKADVTTDVMRSYRARAKSKECVDCGEPVLSGHPRCLECFKGRG